jgi:hypothetical protein
MSKRNTKKETKRLGDQTDDIELRNTSDSPIKPNEAPSSPYDVPREDRAAASHTFTSDVDQQRLLAQIKSEVSMLREEVSSLAKRVEKLERD